MSIILLAAGIGKHEIILTNALWRGWHTHRQTLALLFAFANRLPLLMRAQGVAPPGGKQAIREKFELAGQTLCVIGLGHIGGTLVEKAKALGMHVIGVRRTDAPFPGIDALDRNDRNRSRHCPRQIMLRLVYHSLLRRLRWSGERTHADEAKRLYL